MLQVLPLQQLLLSPLLVLRLLGHDHLLQPHLVHLYLLLLLRLRHSVLLMQLSLQRVKLPLSFFRIRLVKLSYYFVAVLWAEVWFLVLLLVLLVRLALGFGPLHLLPNKLLVLLLVSETLLLRRLHHSFLLLDVVDELRFLCFP